MTDNDIETLLEAHEAIIVEREEWKQTNSKELVAGEDRFVQGNINGLNEARNRIEEMIQERGTVTESDIAEYYADKVNERVKEVGR